MKKLIALTLALVTILALLSSCTAPHSHVYHEKWSADLEYHWHYCEYDGCTEISDKAPHEWDEGVIVAEPTPLLDGLIKYTCTACGAIDSKTYKYEGE